MLSKIDSYIIARIQAGYEYLLDRFGVLLGDCIMASAAPLVAISAYHFSNSEILASAFSGALVIIIALRGSVVRRDQASNSLKAHNLQAFAERAMSWSRLPWVGGWIILDAVTAPFFPLGLTIRTEAFDFSYFAYFYLVCITLRERDDSRFKRARLAFNPG